MMMSSIDFNKIEKGAFVKESIDILHQAYMSKKIGLVCRGGSRSELRYASLG